jgi:hypothetical protein
VVPNEKKNCQGTQKWKRQGIMMMDTATVLPRHDPTKKRQSDFGIINSQTRGGMCYHQNLTESEVGRDQDGLEEYTWKKDVNRPVTKSLG